MTREEFEIEYVNRHMNYDPRCSASKINSVKRLRKGEYYTDSHIDLCWSVQKVRDGIDEREFFTTKYRKELKNSLRW